jgi:hypothetical protein
MMRGIPGWIQAALFVMFLGLLQVVVVSISNQNRGIVDQLIRKVK